MRYCINSALLRFIALEVWKPKAMATCCYLQCRGEVGGLVMTTKLERAVLAGGRFWGMQDLIRKLPGVVAHV
jgi:hypothetical protein